MMVLQRMLFSLGIATTIGPLTGLGLSFTALSPLIMGGIIAAVPAALLACLIISGRRLSEKKLFSDCLFLCCRYCNWSWSCCSCNGYFPWCNPWNGICTALAGAVIAPIAVIAGVFVTVCVIEPIAKKVNEYIISPIVGKCFSSKEEENGLVKG